MRYRIKEYSVAIGATTAQFGIPVSKEVYDSLTISSGSQLDAASVRKVTEAIRLIADETQGGYALCSTGQKLVNGVTKSSNSTTYTVSITILKSDLTTAADGDADDIAAIAAMTANDQFTIEMDWGEAPSDLGGGGGGAGIDIMTSAEYAPALSDLADMIDALDDESESASE